MMKFIKWPSIVLILLIFSACEEEEKKPEFLWEEDRFVEVLTEFQKAESIVRLGYHKFPDSIYSNDSIYAAVFEKLNIQEADFDSNYRYFLKDPKAMELIYDKVITNLSQEAAELQSKKD